jgi:hypothetical protein
LAKPVRKSHRLNRLRNTSSWRGSGVLRTGDAVTRVVATRDQDANVPTAHATATAAQNTSVPSTGAPSTDSSPIFGWWTTTSPDVIHDSSSSKGYGATDLNDEATIKISTISQLRRHGLTWCGLQDHTLR